jgi:pyruvate dehydrogenase E2 component (dihydrolipoamide acetyltransferase)
MAKLRAITIPKWGIEMEHGTISEWRVALGESFSQGDELVDIETDKIVNSFEASGDGTLVRIIAQEGEELNVGTLIGVMATAPASEAEIDAFIAAQTATTSPPPTAAKPAPAQAAGAGAISRDSSQPIRISPALRRKAQRLNIDIAAITGTGVGGRILRDDIERARGSHASSSPLSQLAGPQKIIAERMVLAKQTIPHFHLHRDCAMDNALAHIEHLRGESATPVTINHMLLYAVARALQEHPQLNVNVTNSGIEQLASIDVAVAVDNGDTLLTPVIRDIGHKSLADIATTASGVVERTRGGRLSSGDLQGGAITISNLGMLGVTSFTAIINPPQVMILSVGAIQERVVLADGVAAIASFCALTLACDHRVINGASGARFLADICEVVESSLC